MSSSTCLWRLHRVSLHLVAALGLIVGALDLHGEEAVAVYSRAYNGYTRTRLDNKTFKPESYVFANGGLYAGSYADKSIDNLSFTAVAQTLAVSLKERGYVCSFDPKHTDLLIFVFRGTTSGAEGGRFSEADHVMESAQLAMASRPGGNPGLGTAEAAQNAAAESEFDQALALQALANSSRDNNNLRNARILGYGAELRRAWENPLFSSSGDLIHELEADRYFVVLKAYDFRTAATQKKLKLLWEVRFSIGAQGNRFDEQLAGMAKSASRYFGENVQHLARQSVPEGKVEVGKPTVIEMGVK